MRRTFAGFLAVAAMSIALPALAADTDQKSDPLGDLITGALTGTMPGSVEYKMKATLYHAGAKGIRALDSLGCKVVAMRTLAVDKTVIPRRTVVFIKETVGLPMPNGETARRLLVRLRRRRRDQGQQAGPVQRQGARVDEASDGPEPLDPLGDQGRRVQGLPAGIGGPRPETPHSRSPCPSSRREGSSCLRLPVSPPLPQGRPAAPPGFRVLEATASEAPPTTLTKEPVPGS